MTSYPTVTLSRREIDDLVRKEIANRAGVLRSDVGKLRYKLTRRRSGVYGLHKVVASLGLPSWHLRGDVPASTVSTR